MSNKYIEVSDLEDLKEYISGNGSAEKSKGNVWFNKSGYNGNNVLLVAEKEKLTINAYQSIISILQIMFDTNKPVAYFKLNYPDLISGDKEFNGFKIEVNPTKTEFEERLIPSGSGYEFVRITIDKDKVNSYLSGNIITDKEENEGQKPQDKPNNDAKEEVKNEVTTPKKEDNTKFSGKLPKTGVSMSIAFISLLAIIIAIVCYKKYGKYKI